MLGDKYVLFNLWITVAQVFLAFVIVVPIGIIAGLFLGESKYWGRVFKPFFYFMASVPKISFSSAFHFSNRNRLLSESSFWYFSGDFCAGHLRHRGNRDCAKRVPKDGTLIRGNSPSALCRDLSARHASYSS
jgi:hypothetical protein